MNIVHVYSHNLELLNQAVDGTQCHLNGSDNVERLTRSLTRYNSRDVMGLIVYPGVHMTKSCLKLIKAFDDLFVFGKLPVIVICDDAVELAQRRIIKVNNSRLFAVNSIEGTVSDVDIHRVFATIATLSGTVYDLAPLGRKYKLAMSGVKDIKPEPSKELTEFLNSLGIEVGCNESNIGASESSGSQGREETVLAENAEGLNFGD